MGRDILVRALEREGVETIFAYPGGASMEIHQALTRSNIRTILPRHEQGGAFAADGYARATGRAGRLHGHQRAGRDQPGHRPSPTPTWIPCRWSPSPARCRRP